MKNATVITRHRAGLYIVTKGSCTYTVSRYAVGHWVARAQGFLVGEGRTLLGCIATLGSGF